MTEIANYRYLKNNFFLTMLKKYLKNLIITIITSVLSGIGIIYAQDSLDVVPEVLKSMPVQSEEIEDVPLFTVDTLFNTVLDEALNLQHIIDSMDEDAFHYRQELMYLDDTYEKIKIQRQVVRLEEEMKVLRANTDSLFKILDKIAGQEQPVQKDALLILDTIIEGMKVYHYNLEELKRFQEKTKMADIPVQDDGRSVFPYVTGNHFSIQKNSPYSQDQPFENDFQVPAGVFYRIQLAAFSQEITYDHFGGINPITTQLVDEGKIVRYFAGKFTHYTEAESACNKVRSAGFRDAFIVAYYNGQRMSVERVREFEKLKH